MQCNLQSKITLYPKYFLMLQLLKRDPSCPKLRFSCSKFNIENKKFKCSWNTGDRMMIQEQGGKKSYVILFQSLTSNIRRFAQILQEKEA